MPAIYEYTHIVQPHEVDGLGHVNNVAYLQWMQEAAVAHSAAQGWPMSRYFQLGVGWVVRSHYIEYLRPAFAGQRVHVLTWVAEFRKITSLRKYRVLDQERNVLARAETLWAFVQLDTLAPRRVPRDLIQSFPLVPDDPDSL